METVTNPGVDSWNLRVEEIESRLGYLICAARNRDLKPCENKRGKGTDHVGEGRCKFHGGTNQSPKSKAWKHGRNSQLKTSHPGLQQKLDELAQDHEVFNLEGEILKLRGIAEIMLDQEDLMSSAKLMLDVSKIVERYHQILEGRKYVISIENVSGIIETVKLAIYKHVPDEMTRHLIAQDLAGMRLSTGRPDIKRIEGVIEGEIISEE